MTAIFSYVKDDIAFIAADTRRGILGLTGVATKVHHRWSEHILLAQTGAGAPMTELPCEMTVWRDRNPGLVTLQGLAGVFARLHSAHFQRASAQLRNGL